MHNTVCVIYCMFDSVWQFMTGISWIPWGNWFMCRAETWRTRGGSVAEVQICSTIYYLTLLNVYCLFSSMTPLMVLLEERKQNTWGNLTPGLQKHVFSAVCCLHYCAARDLADRRIVAEQMVEQHLWRRVYQSAVKHTFLRMQQVWKFGSIRG